MGAALAKVYKYKAEPVKVIESYYRPGEKQKNIDAVWETLLQARMGLSGLYNRLYAEDEKQAEIFVAHAGILEDEEMLMKVLHAIETDGFTAEYAIKKVFDEYIAQFEASDESMLADKALDLQDMKGYLLHIMQGNKKENLANIKEEVILVAKSLLPSEVLQLNPKYVKGIITEKGSAWSHAAILANARHIPMITGAEGIWDALTGKEVLGLDAEQGSWVINPDATEREKFLEVSAEILQADEAVVLQDGRKIEIGINVDHPNWEAPPECYDCVGLYRTEFQYIENVQLPTEEELFEAYKEAVEHAAGKVVTFRTMDIGGDKIPQYMEKFSIFAAAARGVKFCFANPSIFLTQLRAILRASAYGPVEIMFPMVECVQDIVCAKDYLNKAMMQLDEIGEHYEKVIPVGVMIETQAIVKEIETVVQLVDFASVGTNDLAEAVCGVLRMEAVAKQEWETEPLYELLRDVFEVFGKQGKRISVCGEMAAIPSCAKRFAELGATGLSMDWSHIAAVRRDLTEDKNNDKIELKY